MSRIELLNKLLNMDSPVYNLSKELNKFGWDSEEELVTLTRRHILNVLKRYQEGSVNETDIEEWAGLIEVREDVGRENSYEDVINIVLNELANPFLTESITKQRVLILNDMLK